MTAASSTSAAKPRTDRKHQTSVNPFYARCVCVTATFFVTGCAVLAFAASCVLLALLDDGAGPCPAQVRTYAFSAAGALFGAGCLLLLYWCSRKKRLNREALVEEPIPVKEEHYKKKLSSAGVEEAPPQQVASPSCEEPSQEPPLDTSEEMNNFSMTQKSADVSYWIEQQETESKEIPKRESLPLESKDGATAEIEKESSDSEMTAL